MLNLNVLAFCISPVGYLFFVLASWFWSFVCEVKNIACDLVCDGIAACSAYHNPAPVCISCQTAKPTVTLMPCGHTLYCSRCFSAQVARWEETRVTKKECAFCHTPIQLDATPMRIPLLVSILVGLLPCVFYKNIVIIDDYPVSVYGLGIVSAILCFLALSPYWVFPRPEKRRHVKVFAIEAGVFLALLWIWVIVHPIHPVLASQLFSTFFVFAPLILFGSSFQFGRLAVFLAMFVSLWALCIAAFSTYQIASKFVALDLNPIVIRGSMPISV